MKKFAFTCGDINGIGPEISIKAFNKLYSPSKNKFFLYIPANIFEYAVKQIKPLFKYEIVRQLSEENLISKRITIVDIGNANRAIGKPSKISGDTSFKSVRMAFESVIRGNADALITSPISKEALSKAGIKFPGHTEMLAQWSRVKKPVMMFYSDKMICSLVTIHEPVKYLPELINKRNVYLTIKITLETLTNDFRIPKPKIAVLGLNPHAGEKGRIGMEETIIIKPVIDSFKNKLIEGPFVPDAFFGNKLYKNYNAVIGMYHDQVLIPFKMLSFSKGVNYTAGLNIIRTSPDHGTAFDIAWKNRANPCSLIEAFKLASKIVDKRKII